MTLVRNKSTSITIEHDEYRMDTLPIVVDSENGLGHITIGDTCITLTFDEMKHLALAIRELFETL